MSHRLCSWFSAEESDWCKRDIVTWPEDDGLIEKLRLHGKAHNIHNCRRYNRQENPHKMAINFKQIEKSKSAGLRSTQHVSIQVVVSYEFDSSVCIWYGQKTSKMMNEYLYFHNPLLNRVWSNGFSPPCITNSSKRNIEETRQKMRV